MNISKIEVIINQDPEFDIIKLYFDLESPFSIEDKDEPYYEYTTVPPFEFEARANKGVEYVMEEIISNLSFHDKIPELYVIDVKVRKLIHKIELQKEEE